MMWRFGNGTIHLELWRQSNSKVWDR